MFWKNIVDFDENPNTIVANTDLAQFSQVFGNHSLFHHFAKNTEVI